MRIYKVAESITFSGVDISRSKGRLTTMPSTATIKPDTTPNIIELCMQVRSALGFRAPR